MASADGCRSTPQKGDLFRITSTYYESGYTNVREDDVVTFHRRETDTKWKVSFARRFDGREVNTNKIHVNPSLCEPVPQKSKEEKKPRPSGKVRKVRKAILERVEVARTRRSLRSQSSGGKESGSSRSTSRTSLSDVQTTHNNRGRGGTTGRSSIAPACAPEQSDGAVDSVNELEGADHAASAASAPAPGCVVGEVVTVLCVPPDGAARYVTVSVKEGDECVVLRSIGEDCLEVKVKRSGEEGRLPLNVLAREAPSRDALAQQLPNPSGPVQCSTPGSTSLPESGTSSTTELVAASAETPSSAASPGESLQNGNSETARSAERETYVSSQEATFDPYYATLKQGCTVRNWLTKGTTVRLPKGCRLFVTGEKRQNGRRKLVFWAFDANFPDINSSLPPENVLTASADQQPQHEGVISQAVSQRPGLWEQLANWLPILVPKAIRDFTEILGAGGDCQSTMKRIRNLLSDDKWNSSDFDHMCGLIGEYFNNNGDMENNFTLLTTFLLEGYTRIDQDPPSAKLLDLVRAGSYLARNLPQDFPEAGFDMESSDILECVQLSFNKSPSALQRLISVLIWTCGRIGAPFIVALIKCDIAIRTKSRYPVPVLEDYFKKPFCWFQFPKEPVASLLESLVCSIPLQAQICELRDLPAMSKLASQLLDHWRVDNNVLCSLHRCFTAANSSTLSLAVENTFLEVLSRDHQYQCLPKATAYLLRAGVAEESILLASSFEKACLVSFRHAVMFAESVNSALRQSLCKERYLNLFEVVQDQLLQFCRDKQFEPNLDCLLHDVPRGQVHVTTNNLFVAMAVLYLKGDSSLVDRNHRDNMDTLSRLVDAIGSCITEPTDWASVMCTAHKRLGMSMQRSAMLIRQSDFLKRQANMEASYDAEHLQMSFADSRDFTVEYLLTEFEQAVDFLSVGNVNTGDGSSCAFLWSACCRVAGAKMQSVLENVQHDRPTVLLNLLQDLLSFWTPRMSTVLCATYTSCVLDACRCLHAPQAIYWTEATQGLLKKCHAFWHSSLHPRWADSLMTGFHEIVTQIRCRHRQMRENDYSLTVYKKMLRHLLQYNKLFSIVGLQPISNLKDPTPHLRELNQAKSVLSWLVESNHWTDAKQDLDHLCTVLDEHQDTTLRAAMSLKQSIQSQYLTYLEKPLLGCNTSCKDFILHFSRSLLFQERSKRDGEDYLSGSWLEGVQSTLKRVHDFFLSIVTGTLACKSCQGEGLLSVDCLEEELSRMWKFAPYRKVCARMDNVLDGLNLLFNIQPDTIDVITTALKKTGNDQITQNLQHLTANVLDNVHIKDSVEVHPDANRLLGCLRREHCLLFKKISDECFGKVLHFFARNFREADTFASTADQLNTHVRHRRNDFDTAVINALLETRSMLGPFYGGDESRDLEAVLRAVSAVHVKLDSLDTCAEDLSHLEKLLKSVTASSMEMTEAMLYSLHRSGKIIVKLGAMNHEPSFFMCRHEHHSAQMPQPLDSVNSELNADQFMEFRRNLQHLLTYHSRADMESGGHEQQTTAQLAKEFMDVVQGASDWVENMFRLESCGNPYFQNTTLDVRLKEEDIQRAANSLSSLEQDWETEVRKTYQRYKKLLLFNNVDLATVLALLHSKRGVSGRQGDSTSSATMRQAAIVKLSDIPEDVVLAMSRDLQVQRATVFISRFILSVLVSDVVELMKDLSLESFVQGRLVAVRTDEYNQLLLLFADIVDQAISDPAPVSHERSEQYIVSSSADSGSLTDALLLVSNLFLRKHSVLPSMSQILICTTATLESELEVFFERVVEFPQLVFAIVGVERLSYMTRKRLLRMQQELHSRHGGSGIVYYVCLSQTACSSWPLTYISKPPSEPFNIDDLKSAYNTKIFNASASPLQRPLVSLVCGAAGIGKTHFIQQQVCEDASPLVCIPIASAADTASVVRKLNSCETTANVCFTLPSDAAEDKLAAYLEDINRIFFELLVCGSLRDQQFSTLFVLPQACEWKWFVEIPSQLDHILEVLPETHFPILHMTSFDKHSVTEENNELHIGQREIFITKMFQQLKYFPPEEPQPIATICEESFVAGDLCADDASDTAPLRMLLYVPVESDCSDDSDYCGESANPADSSETEDSDEDSIPDPSIQHCQAKMADLLAMVPASALSPFQQKLFLSYLESRLRIFSGPNKEFLDGLRDQFVVEVGRKIAWQFFAEAMYLVTCRQDCEWSKCDQDFLVSPSSGATFRSLSRLRQENHRLEWKQNDGTIEVILPLGGPQDILDWTFDIPSVGALLEERKFVLTDDFAFKLLMIHERMKTCQPMIMRGETGVGKTFLLDMFTRLVNEGKRRDSRRNPMLLSRFATWLRLKIRSDQFWSAMDDSAQNWFSGVSGTQPPNDKDVEGMDYMLMVKELDVDRTCELWIRLLSHHLPNDLACTLVDLLHKKIRHWLKKYPVLKKPNEHLVMSEDLADFGASKDLLEKFLSLSPEDLFFKLLVHPSVTKDDLKSFLAKPNQLAKVCKPEKVVVFFDEVNTTSCIGTMKELLIDHSLDGVVLEPNIFFVAAINPWRERAARLTTTNDSEMPFPGDYAVHRLPQVMDDLTWEYHSLETDNELKEYVKKMIGLQKNLIVHSARGVVEFRRTIKTMFTKHLLRAHQYCSGLLGKSTVSQRDIQRVFTLIPYFWHVKEHLTQEARDDPSRSTETTSTMLEYSINAAIAVVYYFQLPVQPCQDSGRLGVCRGDFAHFLHEKDGLDKRILNEWVDCLYCLSDGSFKKKVDDAVTEFVTPGHFVLRDGVALTSALKENIFSIVACIQTKTPLGIIGQPGSSKTLSYHIVRENLLGTQSAKPFCRQFVEIDNFFYQCSEQSTSSQIEKVFKQAEERQQYHDKQRQQVAGAERKRVLFQEENQHDGDCSGADSVSLHSRAAEDVDFLPPPPTRQCVVFLDEAGLPQEKRKEIVLKVLHPYLDDRKVAFIALSNKWFDYANANRMVKVFRAPAEEQDLIDLCIGCICPDHCTAPEKSPESVQRYVRGICLGYLAVLKEKDFTGFFHNRDLIYLMKHHYRSQLRHDFGQIVYNAKSLLQGLEENFGGIEPEKFRRVAEIFFLEVQQSLSCVGEEFPALAGCAMRSVPKILGDMAAEHSDASRKEYLEMGTSFAPRFQVIIDPTDDWTSLDILFHLQILDSAKTQVFHMSAFPDDNNELYSAETLAKIRMCMEMDRTAVLVCAERIHGSLYELLNQTFKVLKNDDKKQRFANIAIGDVTYTCQVHKEFRCIVLLKKALVDAGKIPAPFLSRFSKFLLYPHEAVDSLLSQGLSVGVPTENVVGANGVGRQSFAQRLTAVRIKCTEFVEHMNPSSFHGYRHKFTINSLLLSHLQKVQSGEYHLACCTSSTRALQDQYGGSLAGTMQLDVRGLCSRLLQLMPSEHFVLRASTIERQSAYLAIFFEVLEHYSVRNIVDLKCGPTNVQSEPVSGIVPVNKHLIYSRSPMANLRICMEPEKYFGQEGSRAVQVLDIDSFKRHASLELKIREFMRSEKACIIVQLDASKGVTALNMALFLKSLINNIDKEFHLHGKRFILLLHSPLFMASSKQALPCAFLRGWDSSYMDLCWHVDTPLINVKALAKACALHSMSTGAAPEDATCSSKDLLHEDQIASELRQTLHAMKDELARDFCSRLRDSTGSESILQSLEADPELKVLVPLYMPMKHRTGSAVGRSSLADRIKSVSHVLERFPVILKHVSERMFQLIKPEESLHMLEDLATRIATRQISFSFADLVEMLLRPKLQQIFQKVMLTLCNDYGLFALFKLFKIRDQRANKVLGQLLSLIPNPSRQERSAFDRGDYGIVCSPTCESPKMPLVERVTDTMENILKHRHIQLQDPEAPTLLSQEARSHRVLGDVCQIPELVDKLCSDIVSQTFLWHGEEWSCKLARRYAELKRLEEGGEVDPLPHIHITVRANRSDFLVLFRGARTLKLLLGDRAYQTQMLSLTDCRSLADLTSGFLRTLLHSLWRNLFRGTVGQWSSEHLEKLREWRKAYGIVKDLLEPGGNGTHGKFMDAMKNLSREHSDTKMCISVTNLFLGDFYLSTSRPALECFFQHLDSRLEEGGGLTEVGLVQSLLAALVENTDSQPATFFIQCLMWLISSISNAESPVLEYVLDVINESDMGQVTLSEEARLNIFKVLADHVMAVPKNSRSHSTEHGLERWEHLLRRVNALLLSNCTHADFVTYCKSVPNLPAIYRPRDISVISPTNSPPAELKTMFDAPLAHILYRYNCDTCKIESLPRLVKEAVSDFQGNARIQPTVIIKKASQIRIAFQQAVEEVCRASAESLDEETLEEIDEAVDDLHAEHASAASWRPFFLACLTQELGHINAWKIHQHFSQTWATDYVIKLDALALSESRSSTFHFAQAPGLAEGFLESTWPGLQRSFRVFSVMFDTSVATEDCRFSSIQSWHGTDHHDEFGLPATCKNVRGCADMFILVKVYYSYFLRGTMVKLKGFLPTFKCQPLLCRALSLLLGDHSVSVPGAEELFRPGPCATQSLQRARDILVHCLALVLATSVTGNHLTACAVSPAKLQESLCLGSVLRNNIDGIHTGTASVVTPAGPEAGTTSLSSATSENDSHSRRSTPVHDPLPVPVNEEALLTDQEPPEAEVVGESIPIELSEDAEYVCQPPDAPESTMQPIACHLASVQMYACLFLNGFLFPETSGEVIAELIPNLELDVECDEACTAGQKVLMICLDRVIASSKDLCELSQLPEEDAVPLVISSLERILLLQVSTHQSSLKPIYYSDEAGTTSLREAEEEFQLRVCDPAIDWVREQKDNPEPGNTEPYTMAQPSLAMHSLVNALATARLQGEGDQPYPLLEFFVKHLKDFECLHHVQSIASLYIILHEGLSYCLLKEAVLPGEDRDRNQGSVFSFNEALKRIPTVHLKKYLRTQFREAQSNINLFRKRQRTLLLGSEETQEIAVDEIDESLTRLSSLVSCCQEDGGQDGILYQALKAMIQSQETLVAKCREVLASEASDALRYALQGGDWGDDARASLHEIVSPHGRYGLLDVNIKDFERLCLMHGQMVLENGVWCPSFDLAALQQVVVLSYINRARSVNLEGSKKAFMFRKGTSSTTKLLEFLEIQDLPRLPNSFHVEMDLCHRDNLSQALKDQYYQQSLEVHSDLVVISQVLVNLDFSTELLEELANMTFKDFLTKQGLTLVCDTVFSMQCFSSLHLCHLVSVARCWKEHIEGSEYMYKHIPDMLKEDLPPELKERIESALTSFFTDPDHYLSTEDKINIVDEALCTLQDASTKLKTHGSLVKQLRDNGLIDADTGVPNVLVDLPDEVCGHHLKAVMQVLVERAREVCEHHCTPGGAKWLEVDDESVASVPVNSEWSQLPEVGSHSDRDEGDGYMIDDSSLVYVRDRLRLEEQQAYGYLEEEEEEQEEEQESDNIQPQDRADESFLSGEEEESADRAEYSDEQEPDGSSEREESADGASQGGANEEFGSDGEGQDDSGDDDDEDGSGEREEDSEEGNEDEDDIEEEEEEEEQQEEEDGSDDDVSDDEEDYSEANVNLSCSYHLNKEHLRQMHCPSVKAERLTLPKACPTDKVIRGKVRAQRRVHCISGISPDEAHFELKNRMCKMEGFRKWVYKRQSLRESTCFCTEFGYVLEESEDLASTRADVVVLTVVWIKDVKEINIGLFGQTNSTAVEVIKVTTAMTSSVLCELALFRMQLDEHVAMAGLCDRSGQVLDDETLCYLLKTSDCQICLFLFESTEKVVALEGPNEVLAGSRSVLLSAITANLQPQIQGEVWPELERLSQLNEPATEHFLLGQHRLSDVVLVRGSDLLHSDCLRLRLCSGVDVQSLLPVAADHFNRRKDGVVVCRKSGEGTRYRLANATCVHVWAGQAHSGPVPLYVCPLPETGQLSVGRQDNSETMTVDATAHETAGALVEILARGWGLSNTEDGAYCLVDCVTCCQISADVPVPRYLGAFFPPHLCLLPRESQDLVEISVRKMVDQRESGSCAAIRSLRDKVSCDQLLSKLEELPEFSNLFMDIGSPCLYATSCVALASEVLLSSLLANGNKLALSVGKEGDDNVRLDVRCQFESEQLRSVIIYLPRNSNLSDLFEFCTQFFVPRGHPFCLEVRNYGSVTPSCAASVGDVLTSQGSCVTCTVVFKTAAELEELDTAMAKCPAPIAGIKIRVSLVSTGSEVTHVDVLTAGSTPINHAVLEGLGLLQAQYSPEIYVAVAKDNPEDQCDIPISNDDDDDEMTVDEFLEIFAPDVLVSAGSSADDEGSSPAETCIITVSSLADPPTTKSLTVPLLTPVYRMAATAMECLALSDAQDWIVQAKHKQEDKPLEEVSLEEEDAMLMNAFLECYEPKLFISPRTQPAEEEEETSRVDKPVGTLRITFELDKIKRPGSVNISLPAGLVDLVQTAMKQNDVIGICNEVVINNEVVPYDGLPSSNGRTIRADDSVTVICSHKNT